MKTINLSHCWPEKVEVEAGNIGPTIKFRSIRGTPDDDGNDVTVVIHNFYGITPLLKMYFAALKQNALDAERLLDDRRKGLTHIIETESERQE